MDYQVTKGVAAVSDYIDNAPMNLLSRPLFDDKYSRAIATAFSGERPDYNLSILEFAHKYKLSARHLRRKLNDEGVSFQFIKNEVRKSKAISLLTNKTNSVTEIGIRLGFSEPSSFIRAFRSWTGLTPIAYRSKYLHRT